MDSFPPEEAAYQMAHYNDDRSPMIMAVCSVFTGVAISLLVVRLYSRLFSRVKVQADDYLAILAGVCLIGLDISACLIAYYGIGKHLLRVITQPENLVSIGKAELAFSVFYDWAMTAAKLSICALLARIFTLNTRWFKIGIYFWATWTFLWWIASWFITFLECRPLSTLWGDPYQCRPEYSTSVLAATFNIVSDGGLLILPQPIIWQLKITFRKKLAISSIFALGIVATIISIIRVPLAKGANSGADLDPTWSAAPAVIMTVIEPAVAVICGNLPMTPKLFAVASEKISSRSSFFSRFYTKKSQISSYDRSGALTDSQSAASNSDWIRLLRK